MGSRTRSLVLCGLSIALLAVGAAIQLPLGPVPFTLQTLMLILVVFTLTPLEAIAAVGGYVLLGAIGLPVFAGFKGGLGVLAGPTGGFIVGFFIATLVAGGLRAVVERRQLGLRADIFFSVLIIIAILVIDYALGLWWFIISLGSSLEIALIYCVVPFVVPDCIKACAACMCARPVRMALGREQKRVQLAHAEEGERHETFFESKAGHSSTKRRRGH